jgi:ABC-type glycerol-3-phosphate transport system substrate-binding protein
VDDLAEGRIDRRRFLRQSLLLGLSASSASTLLAACGGSSGSESKRATGQLKVGVYPYIPDVFPIDQVARRFEKKHSGVKVTVSKIPGSVDLSDVNAVVQKFSLEARRNAASYDLIFGMTPWLEIAPLAKAGGLAKLDGMIPQDVVADMPEPVKRGNTYQGSLYTVPMWADVVGFIYRSDTLKRELGSDQPPGTWDDVLAMTQRLSAKLPKGNFAYGGDWAFSHRLFLPMLVTMTDNPYTDSGVFNMQDPGALKALTMIKELQKFMPPNADQDLGSSTTFQAKKLAMESYWQAQRTRAITAGLPESKVGMAANPSAQRNSTVFWTTNFVVQKASPNKDTAVSFVIDGMLKDDFALEQSVKQAGKIIPYNQLASGVQLPQFMQPLYQQMKSGEPIPMNTAWFQIEQPKYQDQSQRMILSGQSPEETQQNLAEAFKSYQA